MSLLAHLRVAIACGAALILASCWFIPERDPVQHVSRILEQSVRPGMTPTEVEAALDSLEVEHSPYRQDKLHIRAVWRGYRRTFFSQSAVQGTFQFSDANRLVRWELSEKITAW
jgi:hypothetical protein